MFSETIVPKRFKLPGLSDTLSWGALWLIHVTAQMGETQASDWQSLWR